MKRHLLLALMVVSCSSSHRPLAQNPSPMVESGRPHQRLQERPLAGARFSMTGLLERAVEVEVTPACAAHPPCDLLIHFLGAAWLPMMAAEESGRPLVVAVVNLGAGGSRFAAPFAADSTLYPRLRERIAARTPALGRTYLSGFSAGYGSIREILARHADAVDGVLLIDGLHTGYVPERKVLAEGGTLDRTKLEPFLRYAERAVRGERTLVITHSEIFPGTFASTTETADWLLRHLHISREPVLRWGLHGMQQLSEARRGSFLMLGFAGNSGPDHIDQLHGLPSFLPLLWP